MEKLRQHPRIQGLLIALGGTAIAAVILAILGASNGGRATNRALFLVGVGGIAAGVGLMQVIWPPAAAEAGDDRSGWKRSTLLQKILYGVGGLVGVVFAAVLMTMAEGKF